MQTQIEKDIDDLKVTARQLPPMRAYKLMAKIAKLVGPVAKNLSASPKAIEKIKAGDWSAALPALVSLFEALNEDEAEALALDCLRSVSVIQEQERGNPRKLDCTSTDMINAAFAGHLKAMMGAILLSLEVNFKDFFPTIIPVAESKAPAESP